MFAHSCQDCSWVGAITAHLTTCAIGHRGAMFSALVCERFLTFGRAGWQGHEVTRNNFFVSRLGGMEGTSSKGFDGSWGKEGCTGKASIQLSLGDVSSVGRQEKDSHREITECLVSGKELGMGLHIGIQKRKWLWARPRSKANSSLAY